MIVIQVEALNTIGYPKLRREIITHPRYDKIPEGKFPPGREINGLKGKNMKLGFFLGILALGTSV